jgi:hypothetical protein
MLAVVPDKVFSMNMIAKNGARNRDSESSPPNHRQSWTEWLAELVLAPAKYIDETLLEMRGAHWRLNLDKLVDDTGKTGRELLIGEFGSSEGGRRLLKKWGVEMPSVRGEAQE